MKTELKPCPFCGGEARLVKRDGASLIYCIKCERGTGLCRGDSAETIWNTRPAENDLMDVITTLCSYIDAIDEEAGKTLPDVIDSQFMNGANAHETSLVKIKLMIFRCKEECACKINPFWEKGAPEKGGEGEP